MRILALSAAAIMASSAAFAADLPLPPSPAAEPADVAPVPQEQEVSFSGPYAGLQGGGGFNDTEVDIEFTDPAFFWGPCLAVGTCISEFPEYSVDGFLVGGRAGFNLQNGMFVIGIEGDIDYSDMEGSKSVFLPNTGTGFAPFEAVAHSDYGFLSTIRGRAGVAFGRVLVYGTAGAAFAQVEDSVDYGFTATGDRVAGRSEDVLFGWTGGGGIDFLVSQNIIVGAQALYFDLEDQRVDTVPTLTPPPPGTDIDAVFDHTGFVARGHVSFRFGGGM